MGVLNTCLGANIRLGDMYCTLVPTVCSHRYVYRRLWQVVKERRVSGMGETNGPMGSVGGDSRHS
jgi:hypothetical protein